MSIAKATRSIVAPAQAGAHRHVSRRKPPARRDRQSLLSYSPREIEKGDLAIRPIHHQLDHRIEAHIFVAFLAYCPQVTLKLRLRVLAPGLTPRSVLDKLSAMQMVDVHLPTTDGRHIVLPRYTQPDRDQQLLLLRLKLTLPPSRRHGSPRQPTIPDPKPALCSADLSSSHEQNQHFKPKLPHEPLKSG